MMASGLWGVPSYRLLDDKGREVFSCWGAIASGFWRMKFKRRSSNIFGDVFERHYTKRGAAATTRGCLGRRDFLQSKGP